MKSKDEILVEIMPLVRKAAQSVAAQWPGVVEADDVEQEIYVNLLELKEGNLQRLADGFDADGLVKTIKECQGYQIAARYRNDFELFSGNYRYSGEEVRSLLDSGALVFADEMTVTERVDLTNAMQRLGETSPQYAEAIFRRYAEDINDRADKDTLSRAIQALTREMNRSFNKATAEHEGPALRKGRR